MLANLKTLWGGGKGVGNEVSTWSGRALPLPASICSRRPSSYVEGETREVGLPQRLGAGLPCWLQGSPEA